MCVSWFRELSCLRVRVPCQDVSPCATAVSPGSPTSTCVNSGRSRRACTTRLTPTLPASSAWSFSCSPGARVRTCTSLLLIASSHCSRVRLRYQPHPASSSVCALIMMVCVSQMHYRGVWMRAWLRLSQRLRVCLCTSTCFICTKSWEGKHTPNTHTHHAGAQKHFPDPSPGRLMFSVMFLHQGAPSLSDY